jgi:hypothetical protein
LSSSADAGTRHSCPAKRRYKATTNSKHKLPVAGNLLHRQFDMASADQA